MQRAGDTPEILYVGGFRFPEGDAAAARVLGIAKALRCAGYSVRFCSGGRSARDSDRTSDGAYEYDGFPYVPVGELEGGRRSPVARLTRYLATGADTLRYLLSRGAADPAAIVVYNPGAAYHFRLGRYCRQRRIPLIVDCTEWYDPCHYPGGRLGLHRWDTELSMRCLNRRADGLIVISSFLERFYRDRGGAVLRIPPVVDLSDRKWDVEAHRPRGQGPLRLVHAGNPGRKELLSTIFSAVQCLLKAGHSLQIEMIGLTESELRSQQPSLSKLMTDLGTALSFQCRLPQAKIPALLAQADFAILLRPNRRFANAGFPTKLVEALASGLPIVTNATSDTGQYVRDGLEGYLVNGHSIDACAATIRRAMETPPEGVRRMRAAARRQAVALLDYRRYTGQLAEFFGAQLRGRASVRGQK